MLGKGSSRGTRVAGESSGVMGEARATGKHVNVIRESFDAEQSVSQPVRIRVAVAESTPRSLALAVKDALMPVSPHAVVSVTSATSASTDGGSWDVAVVLADGSDPGTATAARTFARAGLPVAMVAESTLDVPELRLFGPTAARVSVIVGTGIAAVQEALADWLVRATDKGVAMAASLPFCRRAQASVLTRECAGQNAAVGAFSLVPGSDLPIMAANQVRLSITIAAMYGFGISPVRLVEGAAVVAMASAYRTVAKAAGRVFPGFGWLVRGGVGYAGTMATGKLMTSYYERAEAEGGVGPMVASLVREQGGVLARQLPLAVLGEA